MSQPRPYMRIVDVPVPLQSPESPPEGEAPVLFIFWHSDVPVGQLRVLTGDARSALADHLAHTRWPAPAKTPASVLGPVSLVICTRDRSHELARCLASLTHQTRPPEEVIVVDNASRDTETERVARAAGVTYIREDRPGLDIARNTGARAASGEIVAYTDDDTELHPRWLERLSNAFDRDEIMSATGLVLPARLETQAQWAFESQWGFGRGFERVDFGPEFFARTRRRGCPAWEIGAGANMAFRRSAFSKVGYFDERLDVGAAGCSGDSEYWYRLLSAGYVCRYEPSAVVLHHHRASWSGLRRQIHSYMRGHVAALLIQYERTGDRGNLRRLFLTLPRFYVTTLLRQLSGRADTQPALLMHQVSGVFSGLVFYAHSRWRRS